MKRLIIIGGGGHGSVVADAATVPCVFLDKNESLNNVVGKPDDFASVVTEDAGVIVAIGDNKMRLAMLRDLSQVATIVHQSAVISSSAIIGDGSVVFAGAVINPNVKIGMGCIVNTGATVDHDCELGDGVHISPGANLGGNVIIGECSWIGIGASVKHVVSIGKNVIVGAGAAVVCDIPDGVTVVGVPAKELTT